MTVSTVIFCIGNTPEWQCAVGLFVANAANLMKAIKDTLRASKLAQSIPNNILVSSPTSSKLKGRIGTYIQKGGLRDD